MRASLKRLFKSPVFITAFAFALRMFILYCGWRYGRAPIKDNLPYGYETGQVASSIAAGHGFASPLRDFVTGPTAWFVPLYPYLLAGIFKLFGIYSDLSHMVIETLNCAFAALTIIPIYAVAKKQFGALVASGASWTWVFLPTALFYPINWVWDTALAGLFFALIFWATLEMRGRRDVLSWTGYGALWAVGILINPSLLSPLPFMFAWLVWHLRKETPQWLKPAAAAVLIFSMALVPWTIRNYRVFHKVIVLRSNFGLELWLGNNPDVAGDWTPWLHPNDDAAEGQKYQKMGEIAFMEQKEHESFEFMRSHPADTIVFAFHRFIEYWMDVSESPIDSWAYDPFYIRLLIGLNAVLTFACFFGVLRFNREDPDAAFIYAIVLLAFPLVFYLTHTSMRYRYPMDPVIVVLAASGVSHWLSVARSLASRPFSHAVRPTA